MPTKSLAPFVFWCNGCDGYVTGYYNNLPITRSDGFVVQVGDPDPEGDVHDFFLPGSKEVRAHRIFPDPLAKALGESCAL